MASAGNIKVVRLGTSEYELLAKYIQDNSGNAKTWQDIEDLINIGLKIVVDEPNSSRTAPATTASENTMGKLYMVQLDITLAGTYTEFITLRDGTEGSYTYSWERIGTTAVDLTGYAKEGDYTSDQRGYHNHTVSGTVTVPKVTKTDKKLAATASGTAVGITTTAAAITGFGTHTTDNVLGEDTTFGVTGGDAVTTNIKATASGTAVAANGTANAITALGTPTTAAAITGFGAHTTSAAITGFGAHTTDNVLGEDTTFGVTGGDAVTTNIKATASGTALNTSSEQFVQSYPGETTNLAVGSVTGINGSADVPSSVSATAGTAASWGASVDVNGVLSFSWTTNVPTEIQVGSNVTVAKPATSASNFVTGLSATGTGGTVMVGLGTATKKNALTSASVKTQPTISLATGATAGSGVISVATGVNTISVAANKNDVVAPITALGTPTTANAITALGTPTTANAITGFGTHTTAKALTGVKVTTQPTISLTTGATAGDGVISVATGVNAISVAANKDDVVAPITALGTPTTANAATAIEVTAQPTISLNGTASSGVSYVQSVSISTQSTSITDGSTSYDGEHTHSTSVRETPLPL